MDLFSRVTVQWIVCWAVLSGVVGPAHGLTPRSRASHVVIISIDGGKPATIADSRMPTLQKMSRFGSAAWNAQTISPSITLPSHVSMLTGVSPRIHQVLWNDWIPEYGLVKVPTVFGEAKKAGLSTALFAAKEKFRHLNVPDTLDDFRIPGPHAKSVSEAAADYFECKLPQLLFVHFPDADIAGHIFGWDSFFQKNAFADVDRAIALLKERIEQSSVANSTTILITADHGGSGFSHHDDDPENTTIPWIAWGASVRRESQVFRTVSTMDTAATALWLLGIPVPNAWEGKPVMEAFQ